eukprot:5260112-Pleurochrysis_carterae.AAC.2
MLPGSRLEAHALVGEALALGGGADEEHIVKVVVLEVHLGDARDLRAVDEIAVGKYVGEDHRHERILGADGLARLFARVPAVLVVIDAHAVAAVGVGDVVVEEEERGALRAYVLGLRLAVVVGAGGRVATEIVVCVGDPEGCGRLIRCKERVRSLGEHAQVAGDDIFGFNGVLEEVGVPHGVVGHVVLHAQVVDAVHRDGAVERLVDGAVAHVRLTHGADHVEVDPASSNGTDEALLHGLHRIAFARASHVASATCPAGTFGTGTGTLNGVHDGGCSNDVRGSWSKREGGGGREGGQAAHGYLPSLKAWPARRISKFSSLPTRLSCPFECIMMVAP